MILIANSAAYISRGADVTQTPNRFRLLTPTKIKMANIYCKKQVLLNYSGCKIV